MTRIFHGCDDLTHGWDRVFQLTDTLEVTPAALNNATTRTLNRWRVDSPKGFCFVLHADEAFVQALAHGDDTDRDALVAAMTPGWAATMERADALAARAILIPTPADFTPGAAQRARLAVFAEELAAKTKRAVIWEPQGLWTKEASMEVAEELGLIATLDPFLATREGIELGGEDACFVLYERAALRRKFDQFDFEELLDLCQNYQRVFLLMRGRFCWDHARELHHAMRYFED